MDHILSPNPSQSRRRRPEGFIVGRGGARVTWDDGTTTTYAQGARLRFSLRSRQPVRIEGRLLRPASRGGLGFEAPALVPVLCG
jgi:hypothetical protein